MFLSQYIVNNLRLDIRKSFEPIKSSFNDFDYLVYVPNKVDKEDKKIVEDLKTADDLLSFNIFLWIRENKDNLKKIICDDCLSTRLYGLFKFIFKIENTETINFKFDKNNHRELNKIIGIPSNLDISNIEVKFMFKDTFELCSYYSLSFTDGAVSYCSIMFRICDYTESLDFSLLDSMFRTKMIVYNLLDSKINEKAREDGNKILTQLFEYFIDKKIIFSKYLKSIYDQMVILNTILSKTDDAEELKSIPNAMVRVYLNKNNEVVINISDLLIPPKFVEWLKKEITYDGFLFNSTSNSYVKVDFSISPDKNPFIVSAIKDKIESVDWVNELGVNIVVSN